MHAAAILLLVLHSVHAEGVDYVDKPVCDGVDGSDQRGGVCSCKSDGQVDCPSLPTPARWKALDAKFNQIFIVNLSGRNSTNLEKDTFKGIHKLLKKLNIVQCHKLTEIEAGAFNGVTSDDLRIDECTNEDLTLQANTFAGATVKEV